MYVYDFIMAYLALLDYYDSLYEYYLLNIMLSFHLVVYNN